ncbi:MAG: V-type ATP synthase subunit D [Acholeplasmatales bacterium]|jgi:V/A-type H+-transporting ATPase subunit D|nr:V-type ATP synthase subunit D [Acholeplasmatales bacterium]
MADAINPTRLELTKLKNQLSVSLRGHHLLKDKLDEMIKEFFIVINNYKDLRNLVEDKFFKIMESYNRCLVAHFDRELVERFGKEEELEVTVLNKSVMNTIVPKISFDLSKLSFLYSILDTSSSLDIVINDLKDLFIEIIHLAELEKTCYILAREIERTRRRVNAIEHIMIPEIEKNIKIIRFKLDENERSNQIRLMKSKDILLKKESNK